MVDARWKNRKLMKRLRDSVDFREVRTAFENYEISTIQFRNLLRLKRGGEDAAQEAAKTLRETRRKQRLRRTRKVHASTYG